MKNARTYERKVKKLLGPLKSVPAPDVPLEDAIEVLVHCILLADASPALADKGLRRIRNEFVDFNELRVSLPKEVRERIGKEQPFPARKAETLCEVLNNIYRRASTVSLAFLDGESKRDIRRHLAEMGLPPFAAAAVALLVFGVHAMPVDDSLVELLIDDGLVHPETDVADTQAFLERIVHQKDDYAAHLALRQYVEKGLGTLSKKREAEAKARQEAAAKAAAKAKAAEEARLKREAAKAKAAAEAEKKAAAKKAAAEAKAAASKAAAKKAAQAAKKAARKAAKKTVKKTAKKAAKKTAKKTDKAPKAAARKVASKTPKKAPKKTAPKTAKKAASKSAKKAPKKAPSKSSAGKASRTKTRRR